MCALSVDKSIHAYGTVGLEVVSGRYSDLRPPASAFSLDSFQTVLIVKSENGTVAGL